MAIPTQRRHHMVEQAVLRHADAIAETSIGLWTPLIAELVTIIGARGVSSLYARNVHQVMVQHSWLTPVALSESVDLARLQTDLLAQAPSVAASASSALLNAFVDTLIVLIGESLTTSILSNAWGHDVDAGTESHE